MNEKIIEEMTARINFNIGHAYRYFEMNNRKWTETHARHMAEIDGMIEMLRIVTGKKYTITADGLQEV